MRRRQLLCTLPLAAGLGSRLATAQTARPLLLLVPFAPGASVDLLTRLVARDVAQATGQAIVVENRPGANGIIGAEAVKNAAPDGRTLYVANVGSHAINSTLYARLPYDPVKDFAPVTLLWRFPSVLAVPAASPARSVAELIALARSRPGGLSYASAGAGSGGHLLGEMLRAHSGAPLVHVPYKGAAPAVVDLIGGRVDCFFVSYSSIHQQVEQGLLRILAVAGAQRLEALPQIPTLREQGLAAVALQNWFALVAPGKTPAPEIARLQQAFAAALGQPALVRAMALQGVEAKASTPAELAALMRSDTERLGRLLRAVGATAQ